MLRPTLALVLLGACNGGDIDFGTPTPTTPTVEFDIPEADVDTDRPVDLCIDLDGDRWGEMCELGTDCNDNDPNINGGVTEIPYDGIDNDCRSSTRDDDLDNDGFCVNEGTTDCPATDCDDDERLVHPDRLEVCNDGIDNDCNTDTPDVQEYGTAICPHDLKANNCADILAANPGQQDIDGYYALNAGTAWCDMTTDGGGFTLVMVIADDGVDTFNLDTAADVLGTADDEEIGDVAILDADYKSFAYDALNVTDLLFKHEPSGVWALYGDIGDATMSLSEIIENESAVGTYICDDPTASPYPSTGYPMTAGTLTAGIGGGTNGYQLCSTDLYFNRGDHDVDLATCESPTVADDNGTYGPVWNAADTNEAVCADGPFNDPAMAGVGPDSASSAAETAAVGWGWVTETNTGTAGAGENRLSIWMR